MANGVELVLSSHNPFNQTGRRKKGCGLMELEREYALRVLTHRLHTF